MKLFDLQNVLFRTYDFQAMVQQAVSQADNAQKLLTSQLKKQQELSHDQVKALDGSDAAQHLSKPAPDEHGEKQRRSRLYHVSRPTPEKISVVLDSVEQTSHRVDLNI